MNMYHVILDKYNYISCDTEDWSNDAENTALHHRNKLHLTIYPKRKQLL